MPNFVYMAVAALYHVALAIWIGGAVALGALAAPELFHQLPRAQAGGIFGPILRRFARLRLMAIIVAIGAAAWKHFAWETHASNIWIAIRWICLVLLAVIVATEIALIEPAMRRHRTAMKTEGDPADPARISFMRLHSLSERLMRLSLLIAVVAVVLG